MINSGDHQRKILLSADDTFDPCFVLLIMLIIQKEHL